MGGYTRAQVAALVDHTLLKPETTGADVEKLVAEAVDLGVFSVCVSPSLVPTAAAAAPQGLAVLRCRASRRANTWPRSRPGSRSWP
ncbi:deoxyribose-phosphate aldolase [Mycolicibacterium conceptionense]|uniref:Deoxyribose-phosphate aldolase n=1 Tax=Mycolicibacterium conceptionense TaxID=451644 RepID=A0A0U1D8D7_9MYCO|nr:deoxyribose-phosphate aldolase [Mycolicibacterium conceptionense]